MIALYFATAVAKPCETFFFKSKFLANGEEF